MLDIGWQELFFIGVVALLVVGPKDLPRALAAVSRGVRKVRGLAREFQDGVNEVIREAELDDLKKKMEGAGKDVGDKVKSLVDADGTLTADFDPAEFNRRIMANQDKTPLRSPPSATETPAAKKPRARPRSSKTSASPQPEAPKADATPPDVDGKAATRRPAVKSRKPRRAAATKKASAVKSPKSRRANDPDDAAAAKPRKSPS